MGHRLGDLIVKKNAPCAHLRPDYARLDDANYVHRNPETGEVSWPPTRMADELRRLGLIPQAAR